MNYKQKLTIIFFIIIFSGSFYISWFLSIPSLVFSLAFYSILTYILYWLYKKIIDKNFIFLSKQNYNLFLKDFLYKVSSLIILLIFIIWWFAFYQNDLNPAKMPIYTLSNWDKTVVFQTMSHIWSMDFYNSVKNNISNLKKEGYVLYFEWVRPGSEENHNNFNKALWVKLDEKTYENMSKLYWLVNQDNKMFLWLENDLDYNVDISIDEVMEKYGNIKKASWIENRSYQSPIDAWELIINELSKLRENELKVLRYINKSFVNMIVKNEKLQKAIQDNFANKELFEVILHERNKVIADKIINSEDKQIITIYWMLHFDWVFEILKQNDIKWQITKINYLYPLK